MSIIVIGLGSMGKRRIRLLQKLRTEEVIGVDQNEDRCKAVNEEFGIRTYSELDEVLNTQTVKYALVCTSPLSHGVIINKCLAAGVSVFTEINLVADMYDENIELAKKNDCTLYLSSTALFRNEMTYMIDAIRSDDKPHGYTYHVGQYLPDWHPWESYKDFFIGNKRTNGCREILAIELPWIVAAFGAITDIQFVKSKKTELDIEYNDTYMIIVTHENGNHGVITVDVVCRKAVRDFKVFSENIFLTWKGTTDSLMAYDVNTKTEKNVDLYESIKHLDGYSPLIIENAYESELMDFFNVAEGKKEAEHTFEKDREILKWIDKVEDLV